MFPMLTRFTMTDSLHCSTHFAACVLVIGLLGTPAQSLADSPSKAVTTEEVPKIGTVTFNSQLLSDKGQQEKGKPIRHYWGGSAGALGQQMRDGGVDPDALNDRGQPVWTFASKGSRYIAYKTEEINDPANRGWKDRNSRNLLPNRALNQYLDQNPKGLWWGKMGGSYNQEQADRIIDAEDKAFKETAHLFRRMNAYVTSCYENLLLNGEKSIVRLVKDEHGQGSFVPVEKIDQVLPLLEGTISVEIHIDQGRAQSVEQPDAIQDPRLLQCVQKQLSKTRFSSQDVQTLLLNYVFALNK
jgi:hypothetical protein